MSNFSTFFMLIGRQTVKVARFAHFWIKSCLCYLRIYNFPCLNQKKSCLNQTCLNQKTTVLPLFCRFYLSLRCLTVKNKFARSMVSTNILHCELISKKNVLKAKIDIQKPQLALTSSQSTWFVQIFGIRKNHKFKLETKSLW